MSRSTTLNIRTAASVAKQNMAVQDYVVLIFLGYELFRAFTAKMNDDIAVARPFSLLLFTVSALTILLVRGQILKPGRLRAIIYRLGIFPPIVISYFCGMFLLPGLDPVLVDEPLHQIDLALFGFTPSVFFAQFNTRGVVEWFAFFYYSYFYLMAIMLIPALFFDRGRRLGELMFGAMVVCACGHTLYTLVPGIGPFATLEFAEEINGGFFWGLVQATVHSAGAQLDIFPSLHTAYPCFYALHAFGNRKTKAFKYTWPIIGFFAFNMMIATMFLRWHWGIDVVAGLCLALTARHVGHYIASREILRGGEEDDRSPVWEPLFPGQEMTDEERLAEANI